LFIERSLAVPSEPYRQVEKITNRADGRLPIPAIIGLASVTIRFDFSNIHRHMLDRAETATATKTSPRIFLQAEWRWLVMLNFTIDPAVLTPFVPAGTELDTFDGRHYVGIVGFQFLNTRVRGIPIPLHRNFEELNLRFYVRREDAGEIKRGVVFIKEVVPRGAVAWVARTLYNEN